MKRSRETSPEEEEELSLIQPPLKKRKIAGNNPPLSVLPTETQETQENTDSVILNRMESVNEKPHRHWFFTWNNYPEDASDKIIALKGLSKYAFQEEKGKEGTPHLQGVLSFRNAKKMSTLRNKFNNLVHWEVCRNLMAAKNYCTKMETRNGKTYTMGFMLKRKTRDRMDGLEYKPWQKEILEIIKGEPDERKVYWYWSNEGNVGKSTFCLHLILKHNAIVVGGSHKDAYYAIIDLIDKGKSPELVIFDIPRNLIKKDQEGRELPFISYTGIEGIKNGFFFSTKYESKMTHFNQPHVIVFANSPPDFNGLSEDRWVVKNIDEKKHNEVHPPPAYTLYTE